MDTRRWHLYLVAMLTMAAVLSACTTSAPLTPTPGTTIRTPTVPASAATATPAKPTQAPASPTPRPAALKFGSVQGVGGAGVYVAVEKGYFKEQGITMELIPFRTVAELIAPLGTRQLDVTGLPLSVPLLAAADRGVNLKIVADQGQSRPNWEYGWVSLRKDLSDSGKVKTAADLRGMKIAIPSPASQGDMAVQILVEQSGLKPEDVEIIVLPFAEQAAAFGNKAIAAGYAVEPFIARGIQEGFSVKWIPNSRFYEGTAQLGTIVYGPALMEDQDLARRWMIAYLKGVRDYLAAFTTNKDRDQVIQTLIKHSVVQEPKLYDAMAMPYIDPNGSINKQSIEAQYKWYMDKGLYKGKATLSDIVDLSFAEFAVTRVGRQ